MDAGLSSRRVAGIGAPGYLRPAAATSETASTDLPPAQAVTPPPDAAATNAETSPPASAGNTAGYNAFVIDPQTREAIYRAIDAQASETPEQVPDQTLLRNRAYSRTIASGVPPVEADKQADLEA
jgi:hypothetical protein